MSPETMRTIFEPFFTTKPQEAGTGTGIGLTTSAAIIRGHQGFIQVYSEVGHGSRFRLYLPAASGQVHDSAPAPDSSDQLPPRGAGELVLIVDDDALIRATTSRVLENFGYFTAVAANAEDELEFISSEHPELSLIITDIQMPGLTGIAFATELEARSSIVPIIALSGLTQYASLVGSDDTTIRGFLAKPFRSVDLLAAVHSAIHPGEGD